MSALPPKADMCSALAHVCFVPIADIGNMHSCEDAGINNQRLTKPPTTITASTAKRPVIPCKPSYFPRGAGFPASKHHVALSLRKGQLGREL